LDFDENEKEFIVRAEAPGFEAEDLDIQVSGNLLTIKAQKKRESKEKKGDGYYEERHLERVVTLPADADPDKIEATYRNGILEIHLAKTEDAQRKRIPVKTESDADSGHKSRR
jgi:HSP20 family protein